MKKQTETKNKIIVILGQTATGKSSLAVKLAKKYKGEIISADSRQVYKGLDIGSGKITKKEMQGVPHHMLDIVSPKKNFSVSDWQKQSSIIIEKILIKNKLPIICGGTGFYIQSIVDGIVLPEVPPNLELRKKLESKTVDELVIILNDSDPVRLKTIDSKNKVRLVRAIEIVNAIGKVPPLKNSESEYATLQIGVKVSDEELKKKILTRIKSRMKKGMIAEAVKLHKEGLTFKRMSELGLEYRLLADLLQNEINKKEFVQKLETEIWRYAKRQETWFKRDKKIKWFKPTEIAKMQKTVDAFLD